MLVVLLDVDTTVKHAVVSSTGDAIDVHFSDGTAALYTAEELLRLKPVRCMTNHEDDPT
jgi:hypothetical protein